MFEITYGEMFTAITVIWILIRTIKGIRSRTVSWKRELQLLLVFICIIVVARIVYFPWHLVDGKIGTLIFDSSRITPFWINTVPFVHMFDKYDGWKMNLLGNIAMFIPVGIVWPAYFKKLDTVGKTVLAGFGFTLFIEISQLLFYERNSDIDDIILNTTGMLIGALIWFGIRRLTVKRRNGE